MTGDKYEAKARELCPYEWQVERVAAALREAAAEAVDEERRKLQAAGYLPVDVNRGGQGGEI